MRLLDICDFQGGSQPPKEEWSFAEQEGYIRMLQIRDFTQSEKVTPEYIKISNCIKTCTEDDVLIARYGASIGKVLTGIAGAYNVAIMRTIPDTDIIRKRFLYYYLKSSYFQYAILNVGSRAAQAGFNKTDLAKLEITCPELSKQDKIVKILEKVESIIQKRTDQLNALDYIIKARFVEMFGDENNPQNWDIINVEDVADVQVGVVIKPSQYYTDKGNGVKAFRSLNIGEGFIKDNEWVYFTEEGHKKNSKSIVKENDLLIVRSGAPGTACVVTQKYIGYNAIDIIIVHPDCKKVNPYYLCCYTNMPHGKKQINEGIGGAAQQHFNVGKYNKLRLMLPPKELQDEFAAFVHQVDKSKLLSLIKLLEQLITYLYNVFIIYRQDKGEEVEKYE